MAYQQARDFIAERTRLLLEKAGLPSRVPMEITSTYFAGALLSMLVWWLEQGHVLFLTTNGRHDAVDVPIEYQSPALRGPKKTHLHFKVGDCMLESVKDGEYVNQLQNRKTATRSP